MTSVCDLLGTLRSLEPRQTMERISPLIKKVGITRVADITHLDRIGIPVVQCHRPSSKHLSVSQGKGLTLELAVISGIMEAIEGWFFEQALKPDLEASYNELSNTFQVISPLQFSGAFSIDDDLDTCYQWVKAVNLLNGSYSYIPSFLTQLDLTMPTEPYLLYKNSTNGIATGNSQDESVCHALFELIERDAIASWQSMSQKEKDKCLINIDSIEDKHNSVLIKRILSANMNLRIWCLKTQYNVTVFHCAIYEFFNNQNVHISTGSGAHLSVPVALSRAITEAAQSRLSFISGMRDDLFYDYYLRHSSSTHKNIQGRVGDKLIYQEFSIESLESCKEQLLNSFVKNNINEVLFINRERSDIKIDFVQLLIPGFKFNSQRM